MKKAIAPKRSLNEEAAPVAPGALLGGTYRILKQLGRGGMGVLYLASHARMPGNFVVKVLPPGRQSEESIERFRHGAIVMGTVHHPNVVQLIDFNVTGSGLPYLVMEFLPGNNLAEIVVRQPILPIVQIASIVHQVAGGLHAAHCVGVMHQDLKPSNIMLVPREADEDVVKVIDFGIFPKMQRKNSPRDFSLEGTPPFIAPEQIQCGDVGAHSDQFALAVTSYVLLTGRLPWRGTTALSLLYSVVNRDPLPLGDGNLQSVELVLQQGMAKDPHARFNSVLAFWKAFQLALTRDGLLSPSARYPLRALASSGTKPFILRALPPGCAEPPGPPSSGVPMIRTPMEEEATQES